VGKIGPVKIADLGPDYDIRPRKLAVCQIIGGYVGGPVAYFLRSFEFVIGKDAPPSVPI